MSIKLFPNYLISIFLLLLCALPLEAQWVNNPALNTKIVTDGTNPINISSVEDLKGGAFIFWEDNKSKFQNDIFFVHMDGNGKVNSRSDGKKISDNYSNKINPIASNNLPNTAVVVWKDYSKNKNGNLFAQRVFVNGNLMWQKNGVQVSPDFPDVTDYSICSDIHGDVYISYIAKANEFRSSYKIILQKIGVEGQLKKSIDGILINNSPEIKSLSSVIADEDGGAFLFWLENQSNKTILFAQHIDSTGKETWGRKPVAISNPNQTVLSYSVQKSAFSALYVAWQIQKSDKEIYHQLISFTGKPLWGPGGKIATGKRGTKTNPQVLTADSTIILSWTNEINKDKDIFIQKYNSRGIPKWKNDVPVIKLSRDQFGQKLLSDGKEGAIVAWIDKRQESVRPDIFAQRINSMGIRKWDSLGIAVASHNNTEKSYPSIVSDLRGGAIAIFKEVREGKGEIYAQKIFNTGTYVSQLIGLNAVLNSDSVKLSWYSANESGETNYDIERTVQTDNGTSPWNVVGNLRSSGTSSVKYYEFIDRPKETGSLFYRVIQKDNHGNIQPSDIAKVSFFEQKGKITLGDNSPNPFSNETTIIFYLQEPAWIKFEFFNSHVELIKELDGKNYPKGENKIVFSGKDLPNGVYFYRAQSGDFVDVKKMVLAR